MAPGQSLDIISRDGRLEIVPEPTPMRLVDDGEGAVAVAEVEMPPLTAEKVRETLEQVRR